MVFKIVYYILFSITLLYGMYFSITGFIGIISKSKIKLKKSKKNNYFAIIIPARNEEKVISNLIDSLLVLDYPKDKYKIYVSINNCTDNTLNIVKEKDISIIECKTLIKSKGDVLKYTFDILKDNKEIDSYVIFDADNVVHKDFLKHMNDYLNNGYNVCEGFREAKNPTDNWISGSYTIFYLFQNIFFNKARMSFNTSASINGTGFMISKKVIDKYGFNTYTLTEDVEFSGKCALYGEKIAFVEEAITYDEYPDKFIYSWKQRKRWSAGIIECMKLYSPSLFKNFIKTKNMASLDMALVYLGPIMQIISFINCVMLIAFRIFDIKLSDIFSYFFASGIIFFLIFMIIQILLEIFVLKYKNKKINGMFNSIILFFLFILSWIPINIVCFIKKQTIWEEIKHSKNIKISEIK